MSSRKEEKAGPDDRGGPGRGGAIPLRPPLTRSTTEDEEGYNKNSPSSRAGGGGGDRTVGRTPPSVKPIGEQGSNVKIVNLDFDTIDKSPSGSKTTNSATGGIANDVPGVDTCVHSRSSDFVPGPTSNSDKPLLEIASLDKLDYDIESSDKDARPIGASSPKSKTVNKDVLVIEGREYTFNRQGWARYSRDMLINREGFKRKMYQHERKLWNTQERFQKERTTRNTLASTRGQPPHMRNQTRTTHLRMLHQNAQMRTGQPQTHAQERMDRKRARPLSGEAPLAPGKKLAKSGCSVFCPPTATATSSHVEDDMEEDFDDPHEEPEGRAYWAQYGVRSHTCRIFATTEVRLDDTDITYLSQMMVRQRDKDFPDVNDPDVLAESDKISVDRIGKSGKHIRLRLMSNDGIDWWRNFVNSVPPIEEGSAQRGHGYRFYGPGESKYTYFRVWLTDGEVGHPETGQSYLEREVARGNPQLRGVDWKVRVVGSDGGKVVAKLALPSASAYSLILSMDYRLRYGMDRVEIVPMTRTSVASTVVLDPVVGVDGVAGAGNTDPPAGPSNEDPKATYWRDKKEEINSRDSELETSTETVTEIDDETTDKLLDTDMEIEAQKETGDPHNDPEVGKQNRC